MISQSGSWNEKRTRHTIKWLITWDIVIRHAGFFFYYEGSSYWLWYFNQSPPLSLECWSSLIACCPAEPAWNCFPSEDLPFHFLLSDPEVSPTTHLENNFNVINFIKKTPSSCQNKNHIFYNYINENPQSLKIMFIFILNVFNISFDDWY